MKHFFVINPHSFRNQESLIQIFTDIDNSFSSGSSTDYSIYTSRYPRDAIAVVNRYISKFPDDEIIRIYAVGGDGILFDCLNGMVDFPNAELTSVPYGNDNVFILAFGENVHDRFRDIKTLAVAPSRPVDIINCGSNYAMIKTNFGLVGQTLIYKTAMFRRVPEKLLRRNTRLAYLICAFRSLFNEKIIRQRYSIFIDGEDVSGDYCQIQVANCACSGGAFVPSPYARPDSGYLEVILVNTTRKLEIMRTMSDYNKGHFEKHAVFLHRRCRKIEIKSDALMSVETDGDGFNTRELSLEIVPKGIKFFAPQDLDFADYSGRAYKKPEGKEGKNP